ncbi:MAG: primosomal protein N' [Thermodesulfovibrionales bacterium]|nr:primosomal protein N' [Thermodesulfovibrionales bacterium]
MEFIDVLFPINLGPLTYKCPDNLIDKALPGMLVSAPLKNQIAKGIILSKSSHAARSAPNALRYISDIHGESPMLEAPLLKLLDWMSDYYIANKGVVLKNMLPKEAFKKVKARETQGREQGAESTEQRPLNEIEENIISAINGSVVNKEYKTFLLHAPASFYEISFIRKLLQTRQQGSAIILVPEIVHISHLEPFIREIAEEKLCILHSAMSHGQRSATIEKVLSGECNVVLGTRAAVFAPLKNVSLLLVMQEHSSSYKTEEGLRYNARDVAVMRGYLEKATVVLSSICPSLESIYNVKQNKYTFLKPEAPVQRSKIRILNMYNEKQPVQNISKTVIDAASYAIKKNERIMFVINRKGYSLLTCKECDNTETCNSCGIPLIFHKDDKVLRCHYCGFSSLPPEKCKKCGSVKIELIGTGIQRVEENIKKLFNIDPVRLDSDRIEKKAAKAGLSEMIKGETIVLGTKLMTKRLTSQDGFDMGAVLNADIYINLPDFRAIEKAYQELSAIADKIKPLGRVFIQTRMPRNYLFKFIRNYDYAGFCEEELSKRKEMSYPPYSKIALITFKGSDYDDNRVAEVIKKLVEDNKDLEILGPSVSMSRKGRKERTMLIKTTSKTKLYSSAKEFLKLAEGCKNLKISIAVDP